jgi:hypothetical protein
MSTITKGQIQRLQIVYGQFSRRSLDLDSSRECRLRWASKQLGRTVESFSALSRDEAKRLIDLLQGAMGIAPTKLRHNHGRRYVSQRDAVKAATEGRHDQQFPEVTLASAEDLARVQHGIELLGWTRAQFDAWLRSTRSPLARRVGGVVQAPINPRIITLGEANKVWWALKGMARAQGKWEAR